MLRQSPLSLVSSFLQQLRQLLLLIATSSFKKILLLNQRSVNSFHKIGIFLKQSFPNEKNAVLLILKKVEQVFKNESC